MQYYTTFRKERFIIFFAANLRQDVVVFL